MKNPRSKKGTFLEMRLNFLLAGFFLGFTAVIFRLFQIQVIGHEKYYRMGRDQYQRAKDISAERGSIYSMDGSLLAGTVDNYLMYGEPKVVKSKAEVSHTLAEYLSIQEQAKVAEQSINADKNSDTEKTDEIDQKQLPKYDFEYFYKKIFDSLSLDLYWVPLWRNLNHDQMLDIDAMAIEGIGFEKEPSRYYPEDTLASHVIGFIASNDKGEKVGYNGIEGHFNEDLQGKTGRVVEEIDAMGNPILAGSYRESEPMQGRDVILTIDRSVQYIVEKMLKEGVEKYDAVSGTVIVMDPYTGAVIAMANYPTYHPTDFSPDRESETEGFDGHRKKVERKNLAIQQTYEPGSVMKPMTVSAAVDLGLVSANTTYEDNGPVYYSGYKIDNWDGKHHGTLTITRLLELSNNIGASWVGHKVGAEKLRSYLSNFGFGTITGIELQGEDTGTLHEASTWSDVGLANISFGQGISATPLQVLNAFNVIANGGTLYQPNIISGINDGTKLLQINPKPIRRVISEETSKEMVKMLESAAESGEAKYYVIKDYKIAGKTGTAQVPEAGGYADDKTNATFVGFLSGNKRISMIVKLEEPKSSVYAALTSVPLWMDILNELVKYYGIAPDKIPASVSQ